MKLYGDYHIHSKFSRDAGSQGTIDEIARVAKEKGLVEVAITDHGPKVWVGAKLKHYPQIKAMIERAESDHAVRIFFGIEANIRGMKGETDVPQEYLKNLDIIVCGFHPRTRPASFGALMTMFWPNYIFMFTHAAFRYYPKWLRRRNTAAIKRVLEQNNIDVLAHPNRYFKVDFPEVAKACVENGTLIELNGKGISFRPIDFERAVAIGAKFVIGSDAHRLSEIGRTERIGEFLKNCDFQESDIVNLSGLFKRPEVNRLVKISEEVENLNQGESYTESESRKLTKKEIKENKRREKMMRNKAVD